MIKNLLLVFIGGGLGSVLRYLLSKFLNQPGFTFPLGTFAVNIIGSFILGFLIGYLARHNYFNSEIQLIFAIGFCGGFTTFSTFSSENYTLLRGGDYQYLLFYAFLSLILGVLAIGLGFFTSKLT